MSNNTNSEVYNSGRYNSGRKNSGNWNSGHWNSGSRNSGSRNSGHWNSGSRNSGNWNSGDLNSGDLNSGDLNSGDCNSGRLNSGFFNTNEPNVRMFNKETNFKRSEITIPIFLYNLVLTEWIDESDMTTQEKKDNPNFSTEGGYLKTYGYEEAWANLWKNVTKENIKELKALPNFDAEIFKEITGIDIENDNDKKKELIEKAQELKNKADELLRQAEKM